MQSLDPFRTPPAVRPHLLAARLTRMAKHRSDMSEREKRDEAAVLRFKVKIMWWACTGLAGTIGTILLNLWMSKLMGHG